ncbi:helicase-associated domain-containing protein [Microbacterium sp. zg.B48]|uniref:helicase-associated domain-containing protein n=1 Tax=unclassified Microbacterium TaxID=2609290 RepID=UPI00214ABCBA|nr:MULTISPECIES: helicase-associated domain-containing protein [unclassified Microbacterium]MCR2762514.1 helicase-associated domain-containing protein [Microbacterium sp. zg.B48]MCR2810684.1 helicase-associated domain-containing protein [Microbacterium sp. zg.B185]WIM18221.1 helicase-associated domain-containing protein [Microbacterium sp. zg-B185]
MVSDERALAIRLASTDDDALARTFAERGVAPAASWHDFFDAAAGMLDSTSLERAIARLPRTALVSLAEALEGTPVDAHEEEPLKSLALVGENAVPYGAVTARVRALAAARPDAFVAEPEHDLARADPADAAAAAERAFTTVGILADVLLAGLHTPLARTGTGAVSAVDRRRLTDAGVLGSAEDIDDLVAAAEAGGLVVPVGREWVVTDAGTEWLEATTTRRWSIVAVGLREALPPGLRTPEGGFRPPDTWSAAYPLHTEWTERAARLRRIAEMWGLITPAGTELAWTSSLRAGADPDTETLAEHLPAEIDRVYLQADLTAIAPGPLAPALDLRLRTIAVRESRAQASTYRFSTESLGAGMTEGETAESIRSFLREISLTGIPQPLDYLIDSTAARHGLIRVRTDAASGRTRLEATDPSLRDTILVDQALRPLGFVRDGHELTSRAARDSVYWSLADARYPVVALDGEGAPESLHRRARAAQAAAQAAPRDVYARLIGALRAGHETDADAAWLGRELEQAVRLKTAIIVVVRMPDGTERSLTLEASGLGGGRLRGRDRGADVERTLPVSSIVSVRPAP